MKTIRIVVVLIVTKVVYEQPGSFVKIGAPKADNDSINIFETFHKNVLIAKLLDWKTFFWLTLVI